MSRQWTGKAFIDRLGRETWDTSVSYREDLIRWCNEIQDDLATLLPLDEYKIKLKKLLPTEQEFISLELEKGAASTSALAAGGSLVEDSTYRFCSTFVVYDDDTGKYIESEQSPYTTERQATAANKTIDLSAIPTFSGAAVAPLTIYRRIYMAIKADGESDFGEPFFVSEITNNTATTLSVSAETTSTITPPSDCEIDQLSSDHIYLNSGSWWLTKVNSNQLRRFSTNPSDTSSPSSYDFYGLKGIHLFPRLSSGATDAERTLLYTVYRRPHEIFYDAERKIDMPIITRKALELGIKWLAYDFRDRAGKESKQINYENAKKELIIKMKRQRGRPSSVRDVYGDYAGYES